MLTTSIERTTALPDKDTGTMFEIYNRYYARANETVFQRDLSAKDYVLVLKDSDRIIRGFSTLAVYCQQLANKTVRVIYSGDTIIEKDYWGENQFSKDWLTFAGQIRSQQPDVPLYWLLIVKGHRTYRYLSLFSKEYYPRYNCETPAEFVQLMGVLGRARFGDAYDAERGLVLFPEPRSFLNEDLAIIPAKDRSRPEVQYFLERNPNYVCGDELLCLCELTPDKLTRLARQWFEPGH